MFRRLGWRHLIWVFVLAGITYVCLPFFYASSYTWHLLHPLCRGNNIEDIQGEWVQILDADSQPFDFWYVPSESGRVVILVGGRGGTISDWQPEIDVLIEEGYGVAVLADPGCNLPTSSLGVREKWQIEAVGNYLSEVEQIEWIGAAGFSAGASALALAVPEMDQLQAVVLMGNFADLKSEIMYTPYKIGSVGWLGQHAVPVWYWIYSGYRVGELSPITAYKEYGDVDVLIIHGEYEALRTNAEIQIEVLQENETVYAELWIVPAAYHGTYYRTAGETYLSKLIRFFNGE